MSSASSIFTGGSRYGVDFQAVIDRSVAIASLPLAQMQGQRSLLNDRSVAVAAFQGKFTALKGALTALAGKVQTGTHSTHVSDGALLRANLGEGARAGTYTVQVIDWGSYTTALGNSGVEKPAEENIGTSGRFQLEVRTGAAQTLLDSEIFTATTLDGLVDALNASELPVDATLINTSTTGTPSYSLSLQAAQLDEIRFSLVDTAEPGTELLAANDTGEAAQYTVNGSGTLTSDSRTLTISPGLTVDLLSDTPNGTSIVTVSRSTTGLKDAIRSVAAAFNGVASEIDKHRGEENGALAGDALLGEFQGALREIASYQLGGGHFESLAALYVEVDRDGRMFLNETEFDDKIVERLDDALELLGGTETGFIQHALDIADRFSDSDDGVIAVENESLTKQLVDQDARIAAEQERIERLREDLTARISSADALIASLEQQVLYISGMFESMRVAAEDL